MKRSFAVLTLSVSMAACAPIGVSTPQTFSERLADGVATASAVRTTNTTMLREGHISAGDADRIQGEIDTARAAIDAASALHATEPDAGQARLASAMTDLRALQKYLNTKRPLPCFPVVCWL